MQTESQWERIKDLNDRSLQELLQNVLALNKHRERNRLEEYEPYPKQAEFHALGKDREERLLSAGNQLGKALQNGTPVLTPGGWVAIEALTSGDLVIGGDGLPYPVTGVYPQGEKNLFEVTFDDGASVVCCDEHLWKVKQGRETIKGLRLFRPRWQVKSLKDIVDFGGMEPTPAKRAVIPVLGRPAETRYIPAPLDPYILGLFIGDGCLRGAVSISTGDPEIELAVRRAVPDRHRVVKSGKYDYRIVSDIKVGPHRNAWMKIFKDLGLWGKLSYDKFVPDRYLNNSPDIRLAVLQGLMDSDGSVSKDGAVEFSSASERLARDVVYLVRSLGGKAKYNCRKTPGADTYRVRIRLPQFAPFRLQRKRNRLARPVSTCDERVMYTVRPAGRGEATCISAASPDHTFVTKDFIVTHNTYAGATEAAYHSTGLYPDWWSGRRFDRPNKGWVGGESSTVVRDTSQKLLLGDITMGMDQLGTGMIPADAILDVTFARGVAMGVDTVAIQHYDRNGIGDGKSVIKFKSYEQQRVKWQGDTVDWVWFDEEPPEDIYSEGLARFTATKGMAFMTFTPLRGMSTVVKRFKNEASDLRGEVILTYNDAKHMTADDLKSLLSKYPEHEHECRINGVPMQGQGRIFQLAESIIKVEPFTIPDHWAHIVGLDVGHGNHPTAAVWFGYDRDTGTVYLYKTYRVKGGNIPTHSQALRSMGRIPVAWPQDVGQGDKVEGLSLKKHYENNSVWMLPAPARFPDERVNSVWAGLTELQQWMEQGRFKVFSYCGEFFEEFRNYHMEDGKIVKVDDDLLDATRYALMMINNARAVDRNWYPGQQKRGNVQVAPGTDFNLFG